MLAVDKKVICKRTEGAFMPEIRLLLWQALPNTSVERLLVAHDELLVPWSRLLPALRALEVG